VRKRAYGDWQTPPELASSALEAALRFAPAPRSVLEPTCGEGSFLVAARAKLPRAELVGFELDRRYAARARDAVPRARITTGDFFHVAWEDELARLRDPLLVLGNPPWVTSSTLGVLGVANLPPKVATLAAAGHDPRTGKSNFDVSEWMLMRLIAALEGRRATVALLVKSIVARRILERSLAIVPRGIFAIDAAASFGAAVDAVLFVFETGGRATSCPVFASLAAKKASSSIALVGGVLAADARRFAATRHVAGESDPAWRSGLKHDCARVMELTRAGRSWTNGLGERVAIEDEVVFPLLKSSDVANDRPAGARAVIVPQRMLGEDTRALADRAPRAWAYLRKHRALLAARKSSVYRGQPPFAIFGVGPYSFAPWKVAVSGLYKRHAFTLVAPEDERPVMLDDTCYFLPFADEAAARAALEALRSPLATDFFVARTFWSDKRPIRKSILQALDLAALTRALA
jgi:hypothetical protein